MVLISNKNISKSATDKPDGKFRLHSNTIVENLLWFPVKGLPGVKLPKADLEQGSGIPNDRRFAITRGVENRGEWMPSRMFYVNSRVDGLLRCHVDNWSENHIQYRGINGQTVLLEFDRPGSIERANRDLSDFMEQLPVDKDLPPPRFATRSGKARLWDFQDTQISLINRNSIAEIGNAMRTNLDPLRFRCNLVLDGMDAWEEFALKGKLVRIGQAELEVMRPIVRCPAPGVNPETGARDIDFARKMPELFGHAYCGMYARVTKTGTVSPGDELDIMGDARMTVETATMEAEDYRLWPRVAQVTSCEIGPQTTRISLAAASPWPLPEAKPGQRLRFLMGAEFHTSEYISATSPNHYHLEISKSATQDPATEHLRRACRIGDRIVICGPFGNA